MKRTGSMGSAVPPAPDHDVPVRQVRLGPMGRNGWAQRRIWLTDGRVGDDAGQLFHERRQSGEPAAPRLTGGEPPHFGFHDAVAELAQSGDVGDGGRMCVHLAIHGGRHDDRRG